MERYYDPSQQTQTAAQHDIVMKGRRTLEITGVKVVESFDDEEFLIETVMGFLSIRGENLQMKNLDSEKGIVSIKGRVFEMNYLNDQQSEKAKGFFSKLFR
ncbi:sporulation protein YabP [Bacillus solimangrovi]|uniref:Sporulation protein YabP n=1 Tax=Bacillus solimangrovi TaxID=1305675 RepID=A0A1E5LEZ9_9BACI|nr:sporulation protein YabP [Bacillus solimangrovi]OEH92640.1 sporulation protein YabP [Bacillus solimangrovi]